MLWEQLKFLDFRISPCSEYFFLLVPLRLNFMCRRCGTLCLFLIRRKNNLGEILCAFADLGERIVVAITLIL